LKNWKSNFLHTRLWQAAAQLDGTPPTGQCRNCLWFKTAHCTFFTSHAVEAQDTPCSDGLLVLFLGNDVIFKQGDTQTIKPLRYLTNQKTKQELADTFGLEEDQAEDVVIKVKARHENWKATRKNKEKKPPPPKPEIDIELRGEATALLQSPNILETYIRNSDKWLVEDETTRKLELLAFISACGEYPINLALQQVAGSGKSYTITQTAKYFESEDVWVCGAVSPKALIHGYGTWDNEKDAFIIDLQKKVIVFLDTPQFETLEMLKPLLSRDKFETMYRFVDKNTMKTVTVILRGWPAVIFCSVQGRYTKEFIRRWFTASPAVTPEKIAKSIKLKAQREAAPEKHEEDAEFKVLRKAFAMLKEGYPHKAVIPYAPKLAEHFRAKQPTDMSYFNLFLALIKCVTILHAQQRQKDEKGRLTATMQDYQTAYNIFRDIEKPTTMGLGQNVLDFYQNVLRTIEGDYTTYGEIVAKYAQAYGESKSHTTLRVEYLQPLERAGLVETEKDPTDKRRVLIAVNPLPEESLIDNEGFRKESIV
jgi:hypothetical protein